MKKANPTPADLVAAERLRTEWDARKKALRLTQEAMAERMGGSQSLVSQYLLGRIPLNYRSLLLFSEALGVHPASIRDDLPEQRATSAPRRLPWACAGEPTTSTHQRLIA